MEGVDNSRKIEKEKKERDNEKRPVKVLELSSGSEWVSIRPRTGEGLR